MTNRTVRGSSPLVALGIGALTVCGAAHALPPGFKRVQLTSTPHDVEFDPKINDSGDVVWSSRIGGFYSQKEEIYLYSKGKTSQLTDDSIVDRWPDINNDGVIVWSHASGPKDRYGPTYEIARWEAGDVQILTDNKLYDYSPSVSNSGEILWSQTTSFDGCDDQISVFGVREWKDGQLIEVFDDGAANESPVMLPDGSIVWTRYDFCQNPWRSKILKMDSDGNVTTLSDGFEPQLPSISPAGAVAWNDRDTLQVWNNGTVTTITDNGRNPYINSKGDIAFIRWNDYVQSWQTWLYLGGEFRVIAVSSNWEVVYDMNERGDIVVMSASADTTASEIFLYQRLPTGDMNCDEQVNFDDIDGFVDAITDRATYESKNRKCDWWLADCNGDRHVDFNDIDAFVTCLINNGCP